MRVDHGIDGAPPVVNRAHLLFPDGNVVHQDKLCLTPVERNPHGWHLSPGSTLRIVTWRGVRIVTLICLDIELPALAARIAAFDVDLVLVPSMTANLAGYNRVFSCARARATELLAAVCAVGCIGAVIRPQELPGSTSGAAVYLPCDRAFTSTGIAAEFPPIDRHEDRGPMLVVPDVPIARMRALRRAGAEVWPGAWQGEHISIHET
jgi:predicted amidohydrolase